MAQATHDAFIDPDLFLAELPPSVLGFSRVLLLDDGSTLDGSAYKIYSDIQTAEDDNTNGFLTDFALNAVTAALSEGADDIMIASVDTGGGDTFTGILADMRETGEDFVPVCISSRADADIESVSQDIETKVSALDEVEFFVAQSSNSDIPGTTGQDLPTTLSDIDNQDWSAIRYHDDDTEPSEVRWAASRSRFDLDERSAPWEGPMRNGAPLLADIDTSERKNILDKDVAVGLPQADTEVEVAPGVTTSGRPIYEQFTALWFLTRVSTDLNRTRIEYQREGRKIPINTEGQEIVRNIINQWIQTGESAGHFDQDKHREIRRDKERSLIVFPDPKDDDISNRRLPTKIQVWNEVDALRFTPDFYFNRPS
jgi:hypothetical protein